ncbi:MAG: UDP-3-O-(3-hydroxymyristoyl)glucosamine N-acyltransferase [Betaproteobacteria bacterium]|nr:UDP-3-O-(3-hydroxymyristoyl)glucosamine N-acyltransferase [Betaproteobacteria bacterium]
MIGPSRTAYTLGELVARFGGELVGDPTLEVRQVATLERATSGDIAFLANPKYRGQLKATRASAVILEASAQADTDLPRIVCDHPYLYFARVSTLLNPVPAAMPGVHGSAVVDPSARIDESASIGALCCIGRNVEIGPRTRIDEGCAVGDGVRIGADARLYPGVVVYHDCLLGDRVILHSGAVVGADGFGLANDGGRWFKIPQIGRAILGDDVEVGANTTIDRGAMDDTVIEEGVKLDNQIQVAHNVRIGAHTAVAGCVGIAGSTRIGRYCTIGGAAMIIGHLDIADHVNISVATLITKSIDKPGTYTATVPFAEHRVWLKQAVHLRHLDQLANRIERLEQRINELERNQP